MLWYICLILFVLLIILSRLQPLEEEKGLWYKICFIYFSGILVFRIETIIIPLGVLIALIVFLRNSPRNKAFKIQALFFAGTYFIFSLILPPIEMSNLQLSKESTELQSQFKDVRAVYEFKETTPIQEKLRKYVTNPDDKLTLGGDGINMFLAWTLMEQGIPIKDADWLWSQARHELDLYWSYSEYDENTSHMVSHMVIRFPTGVEYFGVLKQSDYYSPPYLSIVIEHRGAKKTGRNSLMKMF